MYRWASGTTSKPCCSTRKRRALSPEAGGACSVTGLPPQKRWRTNAAATAAATQGPARSRRLNQPTERPDSGGAYELRWPADVADCRFLQMTARELASDASLGLV